MKQKTSTTNKKHAFPLLTAVMLLIMATLTGCSSAEKPTPVEESKPSTPSTVEIVKPTEKVEVSSEVAPESTVESTPEPTTEAVVYEGIDMESTLSGKEWIATFEGVIDEPKLVVFNDSTNKKVIVEDGQEVDFALDDTLAFYTAGATIVGYINDGFLFKNTVMDSIPTLNEVSARYESGDSLELERVFELDGEQITIKVILNLQ